MMELQEHHKLCEKSYSMGYVTIYGVGSNNHNLYKARGSEGENNMGKLTMQLAQFLTHECGWTLQVCDSGNLGWRGEIREQQMKFKAPHPLNMIAPLVMIELRQVGYIEVNGEDKDSIFEKLGSFFKTAWRASQIQNDPHYCDLKFQTSAFKKRGSEGENNMGLRTMELVDFMVKQCQWTMVTCNTGNYGRKGDQREQQLVFRNDEFVQHGVDHLMVELRTVGLHRDQRPARCRGPQASLDRVPDDTVGVLRVHQVVLGEWTRDSAAVVQLLRVVHCVRSSTAPSRVLR